MTLIEELFEPFLWENRDKRLDGLPLMSSPIWAAGLHLHILVFILALLGSLLQELAGYLHMLTSSFTSI